MQLFHFDSLLRLAIWQSFSFKKSGTQIAAGFDLIAYIPELIRWQNVLLSVAPGKSACLFRRIPPSEFTISLCSRINL